MRNTEALSTECSIPILTIPELGEVNLRTWLPAVKDNVVKLTNKTLKDFSKEEILALKQILETLAAVRKAWVNHYALNYATGNVHLNDYNLIEKTFQTIYTMAHAPVTYSIFSFPKESQ